VEVAHGKVEHNVGVRAAELDAVAVRTLFARVEGLNELS
jgi:hypothetical protein